MTIKRGDDAQDHTASADAKKAATRPPADKQDAANYDERDDAGKAIPVENVSSANDEGAN